MTNGFEEPHRCLPGLNDGWGLCSHPTAPRSVVWLHSEVDTGSEGALQMNSKVGKAREMDNETKKKKRGKENATGTEAG